MCKSQSSVDAPFALALVGPSGSGKTTLLVGVVRALRAQDYRVGVLKHSGGFQELDRPGKDSYRLREAGAEQFVLASGRQTVLFHDHAEQEPDFAQRLSLLDRNLDLVLVESYRSAGIPLIEVLRRGQHERADFHGDPRLLAVAADFEPTDCAVPRLPLDQPEQVARFILQRRADANGV